MAIILSRLSIDRIVKLPQFASLPVVFVGGAFQYAIGAAPHFEELFAVVAAFGFKLCRALFIVIRYND